MRKIFVLLAIFLTWQGSGLVRAAENEYTQQKGYKGSFEVGFASSYNRGEFLLVNGYQFNHWLSCGIGTGIQVWQVSNDVTLPLFADFEATFLRKDISPYADFRIGYCFGLSTEDPLPKEGIYISPTIGFRWGVSRKLALKLGAGYLVQGNEEKMNFQTPNEFTETTYFHSLVAKVAIEF